jgi:hypothetical protein
VNWTADGIGRIDLAHDYLEAVSGLLDGEVRKTRSPAQWYIVREGTTLPEALELLNRDEEWLSLIQRYTERLSDALLAE